eukprot:Stramenopile-MAST_4_protein_6481
MISLMEAMMMPPVTNPSLTTRIMNCTKVVLCAAVAENKIVREIESVSVTRAKTTAADILGACTTSWDVYPPYTDMISLMAAMMMPPATNPSLTTCIMNGTTAHQGAQFGKTKCKIDFWRFSTATSVPMITHCF